MKSGRKPLPPELPRVENNHDLPEEKDMRLRMRFKPDQRRGERAT